MANTGSFQVLLLLVALLVGIGPCEVGGQIFSHGICPVTSPMPDLNVTRYAGRWFEMEKYWFAPEATTSCATVDYSPNFDVIIRQIEGITNHIWTNYGKTRFLSYDGSADVSLELLITQGLAPFTLSYPYRILGTDYETYTVKYSCVQQGPLMMEVMWILSKTKARYSRDIVYAILERNRLSTAKLIPSAHLLGARCPWG